MLGSCRGGGGDGGRTGFGGRDVTGLTGETQVTTRDVLIRVVSFGAIRKVLYSV